MKSNALVLYRFTKPNSIQAMTRSSFGKPKTSISHKSYVDLNGLLAKRAVLLRDEFAKLIADKIPMIDLNNNLFSELLKDHRTVIDYLPVTDPKLAVILTHSVLHSVLRFLACALDIRNRKDNFDVHELYITMSRIARSKNVPSLLKPFASIELEDADEEFLAHMYSIIKDASNIECLLLMSILLERSYREFLTLDVEKQTSERVPTVHLNLSFANKQGIFYTPPVVAEFIVVKAVTKFLSDKLFIGKIKPSVPHWEIRDLRICDPACGSSVFLLLSASHILDFIVNNETESIPANDKMRHKKWILENIICGVDTDNIAIELSRIELCLLMGISLEEISKCRSRLVVGDSLISCELLGSADKPAKKRTVRSLGSTLDHIQTLEWSQHFPELDFLGNGGFDIILLNPPYGRLKIHKSDYTDKETLSRFSKSRKQSELTNERKRFEEISEHFRTCGDYDLSLDGELDWYRLMLERSLRLLKPSGIIGCIIPSTILSDKRAASLRRYLLDMCETEFYYIEDTVGLFDTVNTHTCVLIARKTLKPPSHVKLIRCDNGYTLSDKEMIPVAIDMIKSLDSITLPIPVTDESGVRILQKMSRYPPISDNKEIINRRGELDLTANADILSRNSKQPLLVRGDNIERFVNRDPDDSKKICRVGSNFLEKLSDEIRSYVTSERIVGRQVSYIKKKRRLSFSIVKDCIVANSCNYLVSKNNVEYPPTYLLGILNSALMDWRFRVTNSNNHVANYEIGRLCIPKRTQKIILADMICEIVQKIMENYSLMRFGKSAETLLPLEDMLDAMVFLLYDLREEEIKFLLKEINEEPRFPSIAEKMQAVASTLVHDHVSSSLSSNEKEMIRHIPEGGNWQDIPLTVPSKRLEQIRQMSIERNGIVRTTYYGRLRWDRPSYTISTYFSRIGNGCFIHPTHNRLITIREAARLQSFRDGFRFYGSRTSKYKQIGNAVPPLLAMAIAKVLKGKTMLAPFCGAGGLSEGFRMAGYEILAAQDIDKHALLTHEMNGLCDRSIPGDIREQSVKTKFIEIALERAGGRQIDVIAAGPPCQGFSLAGWYKSDHAQNERVHDYLELIDKLRPSNVVIENVQGLMWMEKGRLIEDINKVLQSFGYKVKYDVLKAELFGVPQLRRRVIILASLTQEPVFPKPSFSDGSLDLKAIHTVADAISDLSHYEATKESEVIPYRNEWISSDYQSWCRGLLSTEELFVRREPSWNNKSSSTLHTVSK